MVRRADCDHRQVTGGVSLSAGHSRPTSRTVAFEQPHHFLGYQRGRRQEHGRDDALVDHDRMLVRQRLLVLGGVTMGGYRDAVGSIHTITLHTRGQARGARRA